MVEQNSFLGRGWSFPPSFVKNLTESYVQLVAEKEDIEQSLHILLSTSLGERVMQPLYGCNLSDYQFEPLSASMIGFVRDTVENAILYHEARIKMDSITITESDSWDTIMGYLRINIDYTIRSTNSRFNYVYDFYVMEGNNNKPF